MNTRHPQNIRGRFLGRRLAALARPLVCLALAVFASGIAPGARAAQYYFSATGNDTSGNGSQSSPWRSLAKASSLTHLTGGDQVLFKRGDVWTGETLTVPSNGSPGNPITFGAYGSGALPIFNGNNAQASCVIVSNKSYVTLQDLEAKNATGNAVDIKHSHHMTVQRITARDAGAVGVLLRGGFENHVLDCSAISNAQAGIFFKGDETDHMHDSSIQRCFIDGDGQTKDGIALHEANLVDGQHGITVLGDNFLIKDNLSINCTEQGYDMTSGSNILAESNVSQGNRQGAFSFGHTAHDVTVRYHRSENEPTASAGNLKVVVANVTVEYSTFISHSTAANPMVWVTSTTSTTFPEHQPNNLTLRNNVFVWNNATTGGEFFELVSGAYPLNINALTIKNNIFVSRTSQGGVMRFGNALFPPNHTNFDIDNNLYYGSTPTQWNVAGTLYSFANYQNTFDRDTNGVQADPQFVNIANGNFRLSSANSPAYNSGQNIGIATDPDGVSIPQGGARDIGAFELPVTGAPAAPASLTATVVSSTQVDLAWPDVANETGYRIQRKTGAGAFGDLTTKAANSTAHSDTTVASGTDYTYQIRAENGSGNSAYTVSNSVTTPGGGGGSPVVYDANALSISASSGDATSAPSDAGASNGNFLVYLSNAQNDFVSFTVNVATAGIYAVDVRYHKNAFRGIVQLSIDGADQGSATDCYIETANKGFATASLGTVSLAAGNRTFKFLATGKSTSSGDFQIGIDTITLTPQSGNTTPTISDIADQTINANGNTGALAFTVGDAETAAGSLTVSGSSSNPTLVPNGNIVFGGSGASRTVTVTPATGQSGTSTITVTVSDGSLTAQDTFVVTVNPVVSVSATDASAAEAGLDPGTFTFTRVGSTAAALTVNFSVTGTATSGTDYTSLGTSVTFNAGSATATKTVTPIQDTTVEGTETVIVTVTSGTGYAVGSPNSATVNLANDDAAVYDANALTVSASSGDSTTTPSDAGASGGVFFVYLSNAPTGDFVSFTVNAPVTATYAVNVRYHKNAFRGIVQLNVDGNAQGSATDCYVPTANKGFVNVSLGNVSLTAGNHTFQFQVNGHNINSNDYQIGLDTITLTP